MNLQPIGDKVLIRPDAKATKHGRLFLPENGEYRPRYGTVLAVGPGRAVEKTYTADDVAEMLYESFSVGTSADEIATIGRRLGLGSASAPMSTKVGDRVAFSQYGTDGIETVDGEEVLIIKEDRILAIEKPLTAVDCEGAANHPTFKLDVALDSTVERRLTVQDERTLERQHDAEVERRRAYIERRATDYPGKPRSS